MSSAAICFVPSKRAKRFSPAFTATRDTVVPQIVNALLSRHNFILLGLRGQAKSRILRGLINLLDAEMPVVAGCEINDDPLKPICRACREKSPPTAIVLPFPGCPARIALSKSSPRLT